MKTKSYNQNQALYNRKLGKNAHYHISMVTLKIQDPKKGDRKKNRLKNAGLKVTKWFAQDREMQDQHLQ